MAFTTGSEDVRRGITVWIVRWKRRHWGKKNWPVRNAALRIELDELNRFHQTTWLRTKGHAAHEDNNRCGWLAQTAARTQTSSFPNGSPHAPLRLGLGPGYMPPNPQAGLFDSLDPLTEDDESDPG